MIRVTASRIVKIAEKLKKKEKKWHFHILTPGCTFNKDKRFALILENSGDNEQFIYLAFKKPAKTGKKLVQILYGRRIMDKKLANTEGTEKISEGTEKLTVKARQMIERAIELSNKGFSWHYHLLFPDCMFNKDPRYWTLVFEDPLNIEVIEEMSREQPKEALKRLEPLFYAQKK